MKQTLMFHPTVPVERRQADHVRERQIRSLTLSRCRGGETLVFGAPPPGSAQVLGSGGEPRLALAVTGLERLHDRLV